MTNPPSLRDRLIEDMNVRRLSLATQHNYLRDVARFASWLGRLPDQATAEDLRRYQIEQSETGLGAPAMKMAVSALRFFYCRTLNRPDLTRKLYRVKHPRALPTVLSREEVTWMLDATTSLKHQAGRCSRSMPKQSGSAAVVVPCSTRPIRTIFRSLVSALSREPPKPMIMTISRTSRRPKRSTSLPPMAALAADIRVNAVISHPTFIGSPKT